MERYKIIRLLGDGTYGSVLRAEQKSTREVVAIKKMKRKFLSWDECMALREVQVLRKMIHPNIVKLKEVIRENDELHLVFEYMETNLYSLIKDRTTGLPESQVRNIMYQTIQALGYMHKHGYMHRDMKPENLLVTKDVVKLADFGLVREIRARPPFTDYVSTRWYRAPEVILRMLNYSSPVDIWAAGALMAELYTLRPLFPGSSESDQMYKICSVLGTPSEHIWPEGVKQAVAVHFRLPTFVNTPFDVLVKNACRDGHKLLKGMLEWHPQRRPDCASILAHSYYQDNVGDINPVYFNAVGGKPGEKARGRQPEAKPSQQMDVKQDDRSRSQVRSASKEAYGMENNGSRSRSASKDGKQSRQSDGKNSRQGSYTNLRQTPGSGGGLPSITGAPGPSYNAVNGGSFYRAPGSGNGLPGSGSKRSSGSRHKNGIMPMPRYNGNGMPGQGAGYQGASAYLGQQPAPSAYGGMAPLGANYGSATGPTPSYSQAGAAMFAPHAGTAPGGMQRPGMGAGGGLGALGAARNNDKNRFANAGRSLFAM